MHAYRRVFDLLFCVVAVGGLYVRWPAQPQPYLWLDEAWRAYGAVAHHDGQILQLSELLLGRLGVALFGYHSIAVRAWPLLFSGAAFVGAYLFLRRVSSPGAAVAAVLLLAFGPGFVFHAREFKPYAMDLALAVWSLWAAARYVESPTPRRLAGLAIMLSLYALSSITFVFLYPGIVAWVWLSVDPIQRRTLAPLLAAPIVFLGLYFLYLRPQSAGGRMIQYWAAYYIESPAQFLAIVKNARTDISWFVAAGWPTAVAAYFLGLPALAVLAKDRIAIALLLPFIVQAGFATAGLYPLFSRPSYYMYGLMALAIPYCLAACWRAIVEADSVRMRILDVAVLAAVAAVMLVGTPFRDQLAQAQKWPVEQGRDAFRLLAERQREGDEAFVNYAAYYTYRFHALDSDSAAAGIAIDTPSWNASFRDNAMGTLCRGIKRHIGRRGRGSRLWFISTHVPHAHVFYQELFRNIAEVELVLGEMKQSLILVTLERNLDQLACPAI